MSSQKHAFDIVVVGAGPAGLAAGTVAAERGKAVAVVDSAPWLGGQIWRGQKVTDSKGLAQHWITRVRRSGARLFPEATVFGVCPSGAILAETKTAVLELKWKRLILATGAREVFLPFPGWTLPGVVGPGGLHAMAREGYPLAGKRAVVAGSGPLLLAAADGLKAHGATISMIAEQASLQRVVRFGCTLVRYPGKLLQAARIMARLIRIPYRCGWWPVKAEGDAKLERVTLTNGEQTCTITCDYLACGFHLAPNLELPLLVGCAVEDGFVKVGEFQETSMPDVYCVGEPVGVGGAECAIVEGQIAGLAASGCHDEARLVRRKRMRWDCFRKSLRIAFELRPDLRRLATAQTIVCRCEDILYGEISAFGSWRAAKLQTRCGMGPCQGRTCGTAASFLFGWDCVSLRPPVFPVRTGSLVRTGTLEREKQTLESNHHI